MKKKGLVIALGVILAFLGLHSFVLAEMSSTSFIIEWDSVTSGGQDTSSSTSYQLQDSLGVTSSNASSSTSYEEYAGYQAGLNQNIVEFRTFLQDRTSQVAATSVAGTTATVSSSTGFSVGQTVVLIQNEGVDQTSAVGVITNIPSATELTVDSWSYSSSMPVINGSGDYLYSSEVSSSYFATPDVSTISTLILGWEVTADVKNGYSVYVFESAALGDGSHSIADVADGAVTAGSPEYGARSSDTSLAGSDFDTQDVGITTSMQQVGSRSSSSFSDRDFLTFKLAVDGTEDAGTYTHTVTLLYVGDY